VRAAVAWQGIEGHDEVVAQFRRALGRGRLASSFLFMGPEGIGKRSFALKLAQALLCGARPEAALDPCGLCPACTQVLALTHPDLELVAKPPEKSELPLELLIGDKEHRMRRGLCHWIAMKPFMGGRKVAILDDADSLNPEGANSLLKTLEEPPPRSLLILIGTSPARQLPTIRSRCQIVRFRPLPAEVVQSILIGQGLVEDAAEAGKLARHAGGSVRRALELAEPEWWTVRGVLYDHLQQPALDCGRLATAVAAFLEQSGKEASARRGRMRQVIGSAGEFYEQLLRRLSGSPPLEGSDLGPWIDRALAAWPGDALMAAACADRCLEALEQIERNANQTTLVECWIDDLAAVTMPRPPSRPTR